MEIFNSLENNLLPKVKNGSAENIGDFFKKVIKFQFENTEVIKNIHSSLIKYIDSQNPVFFLRLYGSYSKNNYHLQRRGFLTQYTNNIRISFCDNTFTLLFTGMKLANISYSSEDLTKLFNQKKLIVGFGQVSEEKEISFYSPKGAKRANLNAKGWYQAHIKPTGYGYEDLNLTKLFPNPNRELYQNQTNILQIDGELSTKHLQILKAHFLRLIHPFNSFLVPKKGHIEYNGINIGEENELINFVKNHLIELYPKEYQEFDKLSIKYNNPNSNSSINNIKWFENPINKDSTTKINTENISIEFKDFKNKNEIIENEILSELNIEKALRAIGKEIYATILFPEILNNFNVKHFEISKKYKIYSTFTENSQKSRLSKAKSIFKAGEEIEALINVYESNKVNTEIKPEVFKLIENAN